MKKILFLAVLAACLLILGCASAQQTTTLLVYMCGGDIEEDACEDLVEIAEVEAGDAINVVVLAGGATSWSLDDLKGNSRTLAVIRDGYFEELQDWGAGNMGDPKSLEEFLRFGLTKYPADRTIVILWNHGAGSEGGLCFDATTRDEDGLTLVEISEALSNVSNSVSGFHINIFGCDACMMATYEIAAMLSHYNIDYFVASEELEPGTGWYYTTWLSALKNDPSLSDAELCKWIVDSFMEEGLKENPDDYLTMSAVDLSEMPALEKSMEQFASTMTGQIQGGNLSTVRRGRSRMYTFGSFDDASWDMVDLGAVLDTYAEFDPANAAEAKRCLSRAVIVNRQTDNLSTCCGLSILIPQDTTETYDEYRSGFNLSSFIPNWVNFVDGYVSQLGGGHYQFTVTDTCPISAGNEYTESYCPSSYYPCEPMWWDDDSESYEPVASDPNEITISDEDQGFTAVIPKEDLAYLDFVESSLLMNISDKETECYVELGYMRNNLVDWKTGKVCSLFDGYWPVFGEQLVPMYDQVRNDRILRSLIPVKLNGEYTYLVVQFALDENGIEGEGTVLGANAGYNDSGLPIRNMTQLKDGDIIIPVYTTYTIVEGKDDPEEGEFDGDPITWKDGMTVVFEDIADEEEPTEMLFCFIFNDIFGEFTTSEMISFEL